MGKQNISNVLKLYNSNYYSEFIYEDILKKFHNDLDEYINILSRNPAQRIAGKVMASGSS